MAGEINSVEIFATGVWNGNKKITVTEKILDQMVSSFELLSDQVDGYRPFLKLGHSEMQKFFGGESGAPSLGFISKIWREGGKILANFSNVPDTLVDLVKSGRYNAVSIEFLPKVSFGGTDYRSVLRAVALLGAELPAVKDLKDLSASLMSDDAYIFEEASPVETLEKEVPVANEAMYDKSQVDDLVEAAVSKASDEATASLSEVTETHKAEIEAKDATIKDLTEGKDNAESNLRNYVKAADEAEVDTLLDKAIDEGKIVPADRDKYVALANSNTVVKLGEEDTSARKLIEGILKNLPVRVDLSEKTGKDDPEKIGDVGDSAGDIIDVKVKALMKETKDLDYFAAYNEVLSNEPDLKVRYFNMEE